MGDNRISDGMICAFGDGKDTCQVVKIDYDDFDSNTTMTMTMTNLRATAEDR